MSTRGRIVCSFAAVPSSVWRSAVHCACSERAEQYRPWRSVIGHDETADIAVIDMDSSCGTSRAAVPNWSACSTTSSQPNQTPEDEPHVSHHEHAIRF